MEGLDPRLYLSTFTVTNTGDSGTGSLRDAILAANTAEGQDIINFDTAGLFKEAQIINLLSVLPEISQPLTIAGPGASLLTVRRSPSATANFRIFEDSAPSLNLSGFTVSGSTATSNPGALRAFGHGSLVSLNHMVFAGNQTGVLIHDTGFLTVLNSEFSNNTTNLVGGGIHFYSGGSLIMESSTISGNSAAAGGGIYFHGPVSPSPPDGFIPNTVVIRNSVITNNQTGGGGGIYLSNLTGTFEIQNSTISGNSGVGYGGGIAAYGNGYLIIENSTISNNTSGTATAIGQGGGGIAAWSNMVVIVRNSTITANKAGIGGAIAHLDFTPSGSGATLIESSTITGNTATRPASSGGGGGGIARTNPTAGTITIRNSIVSGNAHPGIPDIFVNSLTTTNVNYSAIGSPAGFTMSAGSGNNLPFGANLLLGPLVNNGGLTQTMLPQPGSPVINAGSNSLTSGYAYDQRGPGFSRISGPSVDIGAVEVDAILPAVQSSQFNYLSGPQSLRYTFTEPVTLDKSALELHNVSTNEIIPLDKIALSYDPSTNTATFTFPGYPNGVLPNGDYRAFLLKTGVQDPSHNHPATDHRTLFAFLLGDLNGDRTVSIADFITLASNFNKTSATYADGDTNYDGTISIADFIDLASAFGNTLGPPPPAAEAAAQSIASSTLFSSKRHPHKHRPSHHHPRPILSRYFWNT